MNFQIAKKLIRSDNPQEREKAIAWLEKTNTKEALKLLAWSYKNDPDDNIREYAKSAGENLHLTLKKASGIEENQAQVESVPDTDVDNETSETEQVSKTRSETPRDILERAISQKTKAIEKYPYQSQYRFERAKLHEEAEMYKEALDDYQELLEVGTYDVTEKYIMIYKKVHGEEPKDIQKPDSTSKPKKPAYSPPKSRISSESKSPKRNTSLPFKKPTQTVLLNKYKALKSIRNIYKLLSFLVFSLGIIGAFTIPFLDIFVRIGAIIGVASYAVSLLVVSNIIDLFIDLEVNTQQNNILLEQLVETQIQIAKKLSQEKQGT